MSGSRDGFGLYARIVPLIVVAGFLACSCGTAQIRSAEAVQGAADLSRGIDFDRGEMARLDGRWELYRGRLLGPGDFGSGGLGAPEYAAVPGLWSENAGFRDSPISPMGVGTMRLRLRVPARARQWGLRVPNADSACRVFVNGALIAEIGRVSDRSALCVPSNELALPIFSSSGEELEILMQVANFSAPAIGTWDSPILGDASAVLRKRKVDVALTSLISGALLIMGLYHLGLFLLRKKDRASLLFGIICLLMAARNAIMGERLLLDAFPLGLASWEWAFKLEHLSAHITVPLFALFFLQLFPRRFKRLAVGAIVGVGCLWALMILVLPAMIYQRFLHWYEFFLLAAGLYVLACVVLAAARREEGALVVALGLLCLVGTAANDVLLSVGIIRSFYLASYGVFLYIFAQSYQLSMLFSKAFLAVEELSSDLLGKNRELESLHTIDLAIVSSKDRGQVLGVILEQAIARLGMDAADILLFEDDGELLSFGARVGFRTEALLHTRLRPGQGFAGRAMQSDKAVIVSDLDENAEGFARSPAFAAEGFFFYAGRRLIVQDKIQGVIELYRRSPFRHYSSWEVFLEALAGQAAVALDNSNLLQDLRRANEELLEANEGMIEGWAVALELRDRETEGHSRRVTDMSVALARRFGFAGQRLDDLRHGALLHDIGKMGIPDSVLLKPGPLSEEEFAIMKRHPAIGRDLLSRMRFMERSLDIPYCHHEKWDGSGYPSGLAGELIPLPARIFAIVDVWDALRSDRPYRKAWPENKVLEHVCSLSGAHFDPAVVEAFVLLRQGERLRD
jgi:HD-GYP domain-containing protein (c-di-GMP phosphodiesterase class II)